MKETRNDFETLCEAAALIYHESRNVRHLIHEELLDAQPWRFVVSLPINRDSAWGEIAPLLDKARQAASVESALEIFESRFRVSLDNLADMFTNENWRHAKLYGGNTWSRITHIALELKGALLRSDSAAAKEIAIQLRNTRHNTGIVAEKLVHLEETRNLGSN